MSAGATQMPTLIVADYSSRCSACGGAAFVTRMHTMAGVGCGVRYAGVALAYDANELAEPGARKHAAALGLPYLGRRDAP